MEVCRTLCTKNYKTKACKHACKPLEKNSRVVLCNDNVASGTDKELEELCRETRTKKSKSYRASSIGG